MRRGHSELPSLAISQADRMPVLRRLLYFTTHLMAHLRLAYWLDGGALISVYREGGHLFPWADDIDVVLPLEAWQGLWDDLNCEALASAAAAEAAGGGGKAAGAHGRHQGLPPQMRNPRCMVVEPAATEEEASTRGPRKIRVEFTFGASADRPGYLWMVNPGALHTADVVDRGWL